MKIVFLLYATLLTFLLVTSRPYDFVYPLVGWRALLDTWAHLIAFTILAFLATLARTRKPIWLVAGVLVVYAATTEVIQGFTATRTPDGMDLVQDVAGVFVGIGLGLLVHRGFRYLREGFRRDPSE